MAKKVSFSGQHQEISEIDSHHVDVTEAIREYFIIDVEIFHERFSGYTAPELEAELETRLNEIERSSSLNLLSTVEAAFRIDYLQRCYRKKKDRLSVLFREIYKAKGSRAYLEDDILACWKKEALVPSRVLGDLVGALRYRHWLAHGRYWTPKLGKKYDYQSVYLLTQTVLSSFPFEGLNA